jgi:GntR family transcriptional regulator / MocR family aminotransferase
MSLEAVLPQRSYRRASRQYFHPKVVVTHPHLTPVPYDHYVRRQMKKTPSGIVPIIRVDRRAREPLHRQIYNSYRTAIVDRALRPKEQVPSTRTLASELGVSRIPVLNAYAQLLAEGYFETHAGAGTVVSSMLPDQVTAPQRSADSPGLPPGPRPISRACSPLPPVQNVLPWLGGRWGAFSLGQPALDQFPVKIWSRLVAHQCRNLRLASMHYSSPMGLRDLREAIATYVRTARGVRCEAEQIMIVSGSQQALEISTRVLLDRGNRVWMEEPGYRFARYVFNLNGCHVVPVPVDSEGLNVAAGISRCRKARAVLITPSHQYPLGVTMSASRRLQLLEWSHRTGSWIIEDDYDSEYRYENMPIASLQGLDRGARVVYIGTFSKVLFPSLRLGYIVIPPDLIERFLTVRLTIDICPPTFFQAVLADFIREGHFSRHIRRMRLLYRDRRGALLESLKKDLGVAVDVTGEQAGLHLSVTLPRGFVDHEIAERASHQKLWLAPLSASYEERPSPQGLILGFSNTPSEEIPRAVRKLRDILHSCKLPNGAHRTHA